jgi:PKD domain
MVTRGLLTAAAITVSVLLWTAGPAMALPILSVTALPNPPAPGVPATLTSTSTSEGTTIATTEWDLDNDGTYEVLGPTAGVTFPTAGGHPVGLRVTDALGGVTAGPVTVNAVAPTAAFAVAPAPVLVGQAATFTSQASTVAPATITVTEWDLDNNGSFEATGSVVSRTFPTHGPYTVHQRVTDSRGGSAVLTRSVTVNAPPIAAFELFPFEPRVGEEVTLVSYSSDAEAPLREQLWDLDGDGGFDDASGARVMGTFTTAGDHRVSLRVTDSVGTSAMLPRTVTVKPSNALQPMGGGSSGSNDRPPALTEKPFLRLLTPFPIVRLAGWPTPRGARVDLLTVRAPATSRVLVQCRGRKCPAKRLTKAVASGKPKPKPVRFKKFERFLPAGTVLEIFVRRGDRLGKYTRFKIRAKSKRWKRADGCLPPKTTKAVTCPED